MKLKINIFPIFLSIFIFVFSVLQCNILVYASEGVYPSGTSKLEKVLTEVNTYLVYLATRVEAIVDGDFAKWIQNREDFIQWWNTGHISYDEKTDSVIFDDDLVKYIKQALKEYAEENMGYWIMPTLDVDLIGMSNFSKKAPYNTLKNIVKDKGVAVVNSYSNFSAMGILDIYSNDIPYVYICTSSSYDTTKVRCPVSLYGADTWIMYSFKMYFVDFRYNEDASYSSFSEFKENASTSSSSTFNNVYNFNVNDKNPNWSGNYSSFQLVSKDGRRIQVFKSLDAYKNHDTGTRRVYFGSKFYEDTGAVTGSYDDLKDWLDGKYDDFWDKLKDLIPEGSNLSEDDLEKLIDKLLDQLDEVGDKIEEGNKDTNNLLQKILDALNKLDATVSSALSGSGSDMSGIEQYLAAILADLDYMVYQMEESNEDEFKQKTDDMFDEVSMTFADLGEIAKTKFPLSVPWDIQSLLGFLGGKNSSAASEAVVLDSFESDDFIIIETASNDEISILTAEPGDGDDGDHGGGGGDDHKESDGDERLSVYAAGVLSSSGAYMSSDGDPVFALPLLVSKSLDIKGTIYIKMSKFKFVSRLGRTLFTCIFAMYLIRLTFNVVSLGKDVFE